jgi:hypothetical protein
VAVGLELAEGFADLTQVAAPVFGEQAGELARGDGHARLFGEGAPDEVA